MKEFTLNKITKVEINNDIITLYLRENDDIYKCSFSGVCKKMTKEERLVKPMSRNE